MKIAWFVPLLLAAVAWSTAAATGSPSGDAADVMRTEEARVAALDNGDLAALQRILAEDIRYVHASGMVDTKTSFLEAIRSGKLHYIEWHPRGLHVRVLGDTALVEGGYAVRVSDTRVQSTPFDVNILVLSVYARRDGRWLQVAWESTRAAGAPAQTTHSAN
jgi:ketosteroid isomerase-like protein